MIVGMRTSARGSKENAPGGGVDDAGDSLLYTRVNVSARIERVSPCVAAKSEGLRAHLTVSSSPNRARRSSQ